MKGIYQYRDLKTDEIIYIGKDSHIDNNARHYQHLSKSRYNQQQINRILQNNPNRYQYEIIYAGNYSKDLLNTLEIITIDEINPKYNFTNGGDGISGWKHTEEAKRKIGEAQIGEKNHNYGKDMSGENNPSFNKDIKNEDIKKLYSEDLLSTTDIAKKLNCHHSMISRRLNKIFDKKELKEIETKIRSKKQKGKGMKKGIPSPEELLKEYEEQNITQSGLAKKYNCGLTTIKRRLKKARENK